MVPRPVCDRCIALEMNIKELRAELKTSICEGMVTSIDMAKLQRENARLRGALKEVMSWIDNWSPSFIGDEEWPETGKRARAALSPPIRDKA